MSGDMNRFAPNQIAGAAISTWLFMFVSSVLGVAISVHALGFTFGEVVDVLFFLQLAVLGLFAVSTVTFFLTNLFVGKVFPTFLWSVTALAVCALQPFAAGAGYRLYGWIANLDVSETATLYTAVVQSYVTMLARLDLLPEDTLRDPVVLGLIPLNGGWTDSVVQIETYLVVASVVVSLIANLLFALSQRTTSNTVSHYLGTLDRS